MSQLSHYPIDPPKNDRKRLILVPVLLAGAITTVVGLGLLVRRVPPSLDPPENTLPGIQHEQRDGATRMSGTEMRAFDSASLQLNQGLWSGCMLPSSGLHFSTNVDALPKSDQLGLESLVGCLRDGGLAGRKVELVGHTGEPGMQGEGFKQADALGQYLKSKGLYPEQVVVASTPDEPGVPAQPSAQARRIDINLLP